MKRTMVGFLLMVMGLWGITLPTDLGDKSIVVDETKTEEVDKPAESEAAPPLPQDLSQTVWTEDQGPAQAPGSPNSNTPTDGGCALIR